MTTNTLDILQHNSFPEDAFLILFGNKNCSVCNPIKLKLEIALKESEQKIHFYYVDTNEYQTLTASFNIFTVPVLIFSIQGKEYHRWVRNFSINEILKISNRIINLSKNEKE